MARHGNRTEEDELHLECNNNDTEQDTVESLCGWPRTGHSGELVWMAQNRTQWRACVDGLEQDTVESLCGWPRTGHSGELVWMA